jgi:F-type H+-transporting ATPase subunit epsilon
VADAHTFQVQVLTPEGEVFDGEVVQLSTRTAVGEIGILANHEPVMARLRPTELRLHRTENEIERFAQGEGWLEVFGNKALVLVGEAVPPDRLDRGDLQQRLERAKQELSEAEEGTAAYETAARDRERAETFLAIAEGG